MFQEKQRERKVGQLLEILATTMPRTPALGYLPPKESTEDTCSPWHQGYSSSAQVLKGKAVVWLQTRERGEDAAELGELHAR